MTGDLRTRYTVTRTSDMHMNGNSVHVRASHRPGILATVRGYGPGGDEIIALLQRVLDADPDTPTTDPAQVRMDDIALDRPDAPVDDGLVEQIARVAREGWSSVWSVDELKPWDQVDGIIRKAWLAAARALVVARPWQAEVEAAQQDTLNKAADEIAREAKTHPHTISESAHRVWLAGMDHAARVVVRLRDRAARGETRQP